MRIIVTKFIYWFSRGIEISTISCRFSLNSYSLARYFVNFSSKVPDYRTITLF